MGAFPLWELSETLHEGTRSTVYRAVRRSDGKPVILKVLPSTASAEERRAATREYDVLSPLALRGVVRVLGLHSDGPNVTLELEDIGGESLDHSLGQPLELRPFLRLARSLVGALVDLHATGIVHCRVNPSHVVVNSFSGDLALIGFRSATETPSPLTSFGAHKPLAETLAYASPEQTGLLSTAIDARTDQYSLGVVFYELLTGRRPFAAQDLVGLVFGHLATPVQAPSELDPRIPKTLSLIVQKLLAKEPEDRYKSCRGVAADLDRCIGMLEERRSIEDFALGQDDFDGQLHLPERLYGREGQREEMLAALGRAASGARELLIVHGPAGVGKTALVRELRLPLAKQDVPLLRGKFEPRGQRTPYSAWVQALEGLVSHLLAQGEEYLGRARQELLEALGSEGRALIEILPRLELLIGTQPPVSPVGDVESQNRLGFLFSQFVRVVSQLQPPLVIFLDDMQWADSASVELLRRLCAAPRLTALLVVVAWRDEDCAIARELRACAEEAGTGNARKTEIALQDLSAKAVVQLVADALESTPAHVERLAAQVQQKAGGNPHFVRQILVTFAERKALTFDVGQRRWRWDSGAIDAMEISDSVVPLVVGRMRTLREGEQLLLGLGAFLGHRFEMADLAAVAEMTEESLLASLHAVVRKGLLWLRDPNTCEFVHDRVRDAARLLLPESDSGMWHLRIGRRLLGDAPETQTTERLISGLGHLREAADLVSERGERVKLARLHLLAGRRCRSAAAFATAVNIFAAGEQFLGTGRWTEERELAFALGRERAESAVPAGDVAQALDVARELLAHATSALEQAAAYVVIIDIHSIRGEAAAAIENITACLRLFDVDIPVNPSDEDIGIAHERVWEQLGSRSIEQLLDRPLLTDANMTVVLDVLARLYVPAFMSNPRLIALYLARMVELSIRHGNAPASVHAYGWFGIILATGMGRLDEGYRFGKLAYDLAERHGFSAFEAKANHQMEQVALFAEPAGAVMEYPRAGFAAALRLGDAPMACFCSYDLVADSLYFGVPLREVQQEAVDALERIARIGWRDVSEMIQQVELAARILHGDVTYGSADCVQALQGMEASAESARDRTPSLTCYHYLQKLVVCHTMGDKKAAHAAAEQAQSLMVSNVGANAVAFEYFRSLALAAIHDDLAGGPQRDVRVALADALARIEGWASANPAIHRPIALLLAAETARIEGREQEAAKLFEEAVQAARSSGFVHIEALAAETASRFYRAQGLALVADGALREARTRYLQWGAIGKVAQIDRDHPHLVAESASEDRGLASRLDAVAISRAQQALSSELVLERLAELLLRICMESAGASYGHLDVESKGELYARIRAADQESRLEFSRTRAAGNLPETVIRHVKRSREVFVLQDSMKRDTDLGADPYLARVKPRSMICLPIQRGGKLAGVLYLENQSVAGLFTAERQAVLGLLAAQAAISLEMSGVYETLRQKSEEIAALNQELEERVAARTQELVAANNDLEAFASSVSHDLRAPLRHLTGFVGLLRSRLGEVVDSKGQHYMQTIEASTSRMEELIDGLLAFSRVGLSELRFRTVDLDELVRGVVNELEPDTQGRNVRWRIARMPTVTGDPAMLRVVFMNLLANAVKFTRTRAEAAIDVVTEAAEDPLRTVAVRDNGVGFDMAHADRLFGVFERLHRTEDFEGTGIGLALVRRIVQRHGGRVWAEAIPGQGAAFHVTLPG